MSIVYNDEIKVNNSNRQTISTAMRVAYQSSMVAMSGMLRVIQGVRLVGVNEMMIENKKFKLVRPYQVLKYIREHALIDFLLEIPAKVETSFPDTEYSLKVFIDPEIKDDSCLDVFIKSRYDARETIDRLDQFNDDYGFDISERANEKLSFNLTF